MQNRNLQSGKIFSFTRRVLTFLVGLAVVIMLMGAGCNASEEQLKKARKEGYNDGWHKGYEKGESDGFTKGENKGQSDGIEEGKEKGFREGYKEGKDDGYDDGKLDGALKFVEDSWVPTLGTVLVIVLFLFLLWLLQSLTRKYRERINTWYNYRIDKHLTRDSLARVIAASQTTEIDLGDRKLSVEILEKRKAVLEKAFLNKALLDLKRRADDGSLESGKLLNECLVKLSEAQSLINDVGLVFEHSSEELSVNLVKDFLEILQNDKSWPIESRVKMINEIKLNYLADAE